MTDKLKELLQMLTWAAQAPDDVVSVIDVLLDAIPNKEGLPSKEEMIKYCMEFNDFE